MLRKKLVFDTRLTSQSHSSCNLIVRGPDVVQYKNLVLREIAVSTPKDTITSVNNKCKVKVEWQNSNTNPPSYTTELVLDTGRYTVDNVSDLRVNLNEALITVLNEYRTVLDQGLHYVESDNTFKIIQNGNLLTMSTAATKPDDISVEFYRLNPYLTPNPATSSGSTLKVTFSPLDARYGESGISNVLNEKHDPFFRNLGIKEFSVDLFSPTVGNTYVTFESCLKTPSTLFLRCPDIVKSTTYSLMSNVDPITETQLHNDIIAVLNLDKSRDVNVFRFNHNEYTYSIADRTNSFPTMFNFQLTDQHDNLITSNTTDFLQVIFDMV